MTGPVEVIGADRCDRCGARDGRRVHVGHWSTRGYDGMCDQCLDQTPRTEIIRGWEIEAGDALISHDGTPVIVLDVWIERDQLWIRYRCDNGESLSMAVHGGLTQRRVIRADYPLAGIPFQRDSR